MSRKAVREAFTTELNSLSIPFHESINTRQKPSDEVWMTAEYYVDFETPLCFSWARMEETGSVDIDIFCKAGLGYGPAVDAAETLLDHFKDWRVTGIEVTSLLSSQEIADGAAESRWYGVTVSVGYIYRF